MKIIYFQFFREFATFLRFSFRNCELTFENKFSSLLKFGPSPTFEFVKGALKATNRVWLDFLTQHFVIESKLREAKTSEKDFVQQVTSGRSHRLWQARWRRARVRVVLRVLLRILLRVPMTSWSNISKLCSASVSMIDIMTNSESMSVRPLFWPKGRLSERFRLFCCSLSLSTSGRQDKVWGTKRRRKDRWLLLEEEWQ